MEGYGNENPGAFQPTRPLRGATLYPLALYLCNVISTHAPLAGRDKISLLGLEYLRLFQPTRPLRGATAISYKFAPYY